MTLNPVVIITMAAIQNQSSSLSPSALEIAIRTHTSLFRWYLVWLVIAAVISATFTWLVWRSGNRQQDAAISETNKKAAALNERAAKAELELEKLKLTRFERFNRDAFRDRIRGEPKIRVELLFQKDDVDSYMFEEAVKGCLNAEGWTVIGPRPIREEDLSFSEIEKDAPQSVRAGVVFGAFAYIAQKLPQYDNPHDPINVLINALTVSRRGFGVTQTSSVFGGTSDPSLPEDLVKIIVGTRFHEW